MRAYQNVWIHICAVALLQLGGGILGIAAPLGLEALGLDSAAIGIIAALFSAGFMAGAWIAPQAILTFGNIRVFASASAILAASALAMYLAPTWMAWSGLRFVQGLAFAWMFASLESWLSAATQPASRGGVMGLYHVVAKAALLSGPFLIITARPLSAEPYIWVAVFAALALVPVCLTLSAEPPRHGRRAMGPVQMLKLAPAALSGVFFAGVINSGVLALLPVFAREVGGAGSASQLAALAMAAAWFGGLITQWPAGRLSDRIDRRTVIAGMGLVSGLAALALGIGFGVSEPALQIVLICVWGAGSLSFYGVAVAHGIDRAAPEEISPLMSGLLFIWAAGSVVGPPLAGASMVLGFGPNGLFLFATVLTSVLVLTMLVRRAVREGVPDQQQADWELARPTSLAGVDFDPRTDVERVVVLGED